MPLILGLSMVCIAGVPVCRSSASAAPDDTVRFLVCHCPLNVQPCPKVSPQLLLNVLYFIIITPKLSNILYSVIMPPSQFDMLCCVIIHPLMSNSLSHLKLPPQLLNLLYRMELYRLGSLMCGPVKNYRLSCSKRFLSDNAFSAVKFALPSGTTASGVKFALPSGIYCLGR